MLMEIEDFKNNNNSNNNNNNKKNSHKNIINNSINKDRSNSNNSSASSGKKFNCIDSKLKDGELIEKDTSRYFVQREAFEQRREKLSPPKMKRRLKDFLNDEQNNSKNSQTTDFAKKILPEVHKDCNCGSPKERKGSSSSSKSHSTPTHRAVDRARSSSRSKDDVHRCSPVSGNVAKKQIKNDPQHQHQQHQHQQQQQQHQQQQSSFDNEPIHMSWDEVMQEAKMLGIPLKTQNKLEAKSCLERTRQEKSRQGKNFYSDGDDCNKINGRHDVTSVASSASSIGMRLPDHRRSESKSPQTFKGMIKLQNFFKKLELKHKSPCHCQSGRTRRSGEKNRSSPRSFLRDILMPQKFKEHSLVSRSHNADERWNCEECIKQCKYCRSMEVSSLRERSRTVAADDEEDELSVAMARSWQPGTSFDQLSLPLKSSSLTRNLGNVSYQGSCYSLSSKAQHMNLSARSFNAGSADSDASLSDSKVIEREVRDPQLLQEKKTRYDVNPQESLKDLRNCLWYWGTLGREGANEILRGTEDGSYLVRNSSDDRYVLALSFRSQGVTHHTGIEYANGYYTFHERSPPVQAPTQHPPFDSPKETVICFIERASSLSRSESDRYYLQPRSNEEAVVPVKLWTPVLRPVEFLRNLATDVIVKAIGRPDFIANLPVSSTIKRQVKNRFQTKVIK